MIRRPLLVQEKVDFYVWQYKIREVINEYHKICNFNDEYEELTLFSRKNNMYYTYNWRYLGVDNNVIRLYHISSANGLTHIELPKYYYFSNGIRRLRLSNYDVNCGFNR